MSDLNSIEKDFLICVFEREGCSFNLTNSKKPIYNSLEKKDLVMKSGTLRKYIPNINDRYVLTYRGRIQAKKCLYEKLAQYREPEIQQVFKGDD